MKHLYILLLLIAIQLDTFGKETVKVATLSFDKDMFHIEKLDNGTTYLYATDVTYDYTYNGLYKPIWYWGKPNSWDYYFEHYLPCVLFTVVRPDIEANETYVSFTIDSKEELVADNCTLAYNPYIISSAEIGTDTDIPYEEYNTPPMIYELKDYPEQNVEISESYVNDWELNEELRREIRVKHKFLVIQIWPFRYDALNKKLYLLTNITLNITFSLDDASNIQDVEAVGNIQGGNIYDLQGRKLTAPPARGIYIKDRIKTLAR